MESKYQILSSKNSQNKFAFHFQRIYFNSSNKRELASKDIIQWLEKSIEETNNMLYNSSFDIKFSGSTCVVWFFFKSKWYIANVGDSRGVLAKLINDKTISEPMTTDHKPTLPEENERILRWNGRVEPFKDAFGRAKGPPRVWLKHEDIPGLAMSRSMGDSWGAMAGVIAIPEIKEININGEEDWFIVIGTDGIWEFLTNDEVSDILMPYYTKRSSEGAGETLVKEAFLRWQANSETMNIIYWIIYSKI